jgi:hypothetical protein
VVGAPEALDVRLHDRLMRCQALTPLTRSSAYRSGSLVGLDTADLVAGEREDPARTSA